MAFERKSMEYLVNRMITWTQGVSSKLTDFRIGAKTRTLMEAVSLIVEEIYDKLYRTLRQLIEDNLYAVFGFSKIPKTYTTGTVTFSRSTAATQDYTIMAGTMVLSQATQYSPPIRFYTTVEAVLLNGTSSIDVPVICDISGEQGNVTAGAINSFVQKPIGIEAVTNAKDFVTGKEEETSENQKARFQEFIQAQTRGVLQSIEFGAKQAKIIDTVTGDPLEYVEQAKALEDLVNRKGEVDLYICNGVGPVSQALIDAVVKLLDGSYDANGNPIYGYKSAGILVNIYSAPSIYVTIKLIIEVEPYATLSDLKPTIESEISRYFAELTLGQTVVQSAIEANVKKISGVYDVKLYVSTDNGINFSMDNIVIEETARALFKGPVIYA